jgi:hypothetical protein
MNGRVGVHRHIVGLYDGERHRGKLLFAVGRLKSRGRCLHLGRATSAEGSTRVADHARQRNFEAIMREGRRDKVRTAAQAAAVLVATGVRDHPPQGRAADSNRCQSAEAFSLTAKLDANKERPSQNSPRVAS